ncbi:MAG: glycine cleavage system aminomethyltransferase GcvT [Pseudomonadota bacterium]
MTDALKRTPLHALHLEFGAKMVPFAGYDMPVQYPAGVLKEHLHTREKAGLFDVSHMGQVWLKTKEADLGSEGAHEAVAAALETLVPGEIRKLKKGGLRYTVFLNEEGGVLDDLMVTRPAREDRQGYLVLVVNAAVKERDYALLRENIADRVNVEVQDDRALLALQGPKAAAVLERIIPGVGEQKFMEMRPYDWRGAYLLVSRCGYTGEDGFEVSVPNSNAEDLARMILADGDAEPIGLGARDSLRLEAGLCLYGHDMDETTTPVEANLGFTLGKRRREEGGFPGAEKILRQHAYGPSKLRVGLKPDGRAPAREGVEIQSVDGALIGRVTSGGFGPTAEAPVAMGYVDAAHAATGTTVHLIIRGKPQPAEVVDMPVVPHRYYRG